MIARRILLFSIAAVGGGLNIAGAAPAQSYPNRPIKLVVPFPPGGNIDVIGRLVAQQLSSQLGQSVIVENRIGAGGTVASKAVATAESDGYTLLYGSSGSLAISQALYRNTPIENMVPVAIVASTPIMLAVASAVPAKSAGELIAYAKANPGKLSHGASLGTPPHLLGEFFRARTGIDIQYVPYRGSSQSIPDLLGGQFQIVADSAAVLLPYIQQGKLRPIVVASTTRFRELPDVPTLIEIGLDGFPPQTWSGIVAPAGTPAAIIDKLNAATNSALITPEMTASLAKLGFQAEPGSPKDFAALVATDTRKWAEVVKLTGVKIE